MRDSDREKEREEGLRHKETEIGAASTPAWPGIPAWAESFPEPVSTLSKLLAGGSPWGLHHPFLRLGTSWNIRCLISPIWSLMVSEGHASFLRAQDAPFAAGTPIELPRKERQDGR